MLTTKSRIASTRHTFRNYIFFLLFFLFYFFTSLANRRHKEKTVEQRRRSQEAKEGQEAKQRVKKQESDSFDYAPSPKSHTFSLALFLFLSFFLFFSFFFSFFSLSFFFSSPAIGPKYQESNSFDDVKSSFFFLSFLCSHSTRCQTVWVHPCIPPAAPDHQLPPSFLHQLHRTRSAITSQS